ncbi:hypothetical protein E8E75_28195 [Pseudomonas sp. BN606]|nr:hypothetical protein [Pseudomonas sp. BN606]
MDLRIEHASEEGNSAWLVHACGMTFNFSDRASAVAFAAKLAERVNAPHQLPAATIKRWAAEHFRMLRGS